MDKKVQTKKYSKKRSRSVTRKGFGGKSKRKNESLGVDVREQAMKDKESMQVTSDKTKGEVSTAEMSNPRGGIQVEKGKTTAKRSADGEIAQELLSSPERSSSRFRPRKEFPYFRMVELNENDNKRIVGMRVKVYWSGSRRWFVGSIKSFDIEKGLHKIHYDDGDKEELDLRKEKFELEITPSDGFTLKTEPHFKKKVKSFDGDKVSSEILVDDSVKMRDAEQLKGNTEPKKNKASKNAVKGRSSKSHVKKDTESKKMEDLVSEMDMDMLPEKVDETILDEVHDVEKPGHASFDKEHDESKTITEIVEEAKQSSELQTTKTEFNSEKPKLASDGCEEIGSATNGATEGTGEVSLNLPATKTGSLVEEENPESLPKTLKTENNESAGDISKGKEGISGGMKTSSNGLQQLADYQGGNDEIQVDWASQKIGLIGGLETGTVELSQTRKHDSQENAECQRNPVKRKRTKVQTK
uniref:Putative midasin n=1 Tax=Davidia involucrata TaxID=16924 RepID=A0A5B7B686_DAVIN